MHKNRHVKKFDNGRRTPQEYHQQFAFPPTAKCSAPNCHRRPAVRAIVMAPFDEVSKRGMLPTGYILSPEIMKSIVMIKGQTGPEPYVRISVAYSCSSCQTQFEKALAKSPSWCIVEINKGPDPSNRIVV